ncbi:MAG TPA: dihydrofolate reductase family protein [Polyangiales bacterium]
MRKLTVGAFLSLDGVMQAPGGPEEDRSGGFQLGGWIVPLSDETTGAAVQESFSKPFDLLLGRNTYDIFAAHWGSRIPTDPAAPGYDEGNARVARAFNQATKYVATHAPDTLTWQNSRALGDDVPAAIRKLKQESGPDLLTQGSCELLHTLLANDLVDQLRLQIFPLVLGKGKRLFDGRSLPHALTLSSSKISANGVLIVTYQRAGEVETGSFLLPDPPEEELKRREKIERT